MAFKVSSTRIITPRMLETTIITVLLSTFKPELFVSSVPVVGITVGLLVGGVVELLVGESVTGAAVDGALVRIDLERSDLGATMSRMEHTIRNLSNIVVNTKAARSRIQDANIAEETTNMTKAQVLSQAAQAMLAQANRTSQSILSLLQG